MLSALRHRAYQGGQLVGVLAHQRVFAEQCALVVQRASHQSHQPADPQPICRFQFVSYRNTNESSGKGRIVFVSNEMKTRWNSQKSHRSQLFSTSAQRAFPCFWCNEKTFSYIYPLSLSWQNRYVDLLYAVISSRAHQLHARARRLPDAGNATLLLSLPIHRSGLWSW
jgi:hypothetical protein